MNFHWTTCIADWKLCKTFMIHVNQRGKLYGLKKDLKPFHWQETNMCLISALILLFKWPINYMPTSSVDFFWKQQTVQLCLLQLWIWEKPVSEKWSDVGDKSRSQKKR